MGFWGRKLWGATELNWALIFKYTTYRNLVFMTLHLWIEIIKFSGGWICDESPDPSNCVNDLDIYRELILPTQRREVLCIRCYVRPFFDLQQVDSISIREASRELRGIKHRLWESWRSIWWLVQSYYRIDDWLFSGKVYIRILKVI